ncbi:MAG: hypothetical protein IE926_10725, partial [Micrococcales bacterium]|nr:hypothetical protein [Micrococcales bacterium]
QAMFESVRHLLSGGPRLLSRSLTAGLPEGRLFAVYGADWSAGTTSASGVR